MTRRGSRAQGRQPDHGRQSAADYTTTAPPPADLPILRCACGGMYRDHPTSYTAHSAVFGHNPIVRKPAPAEAESAPEQGAAQ